MKNFKLFSLICLFGAVASTVAHGEQLQKEQNQQLEALQTKALEACEKSRPEIASEIKDACESRSLGKVQYIISMESHSKCQQGLKAIRSHLKEAEKRELELSILRQGILTPEQLDAITNDCINNGNLKKLYGNGILQRKAMLDGKLLSKDTTWDIRLDEKCKRTINDIQASANQKIEQEIVAKEIATQKELEGIKDHCFPYAARHHTLSMKLMALKDGDLGYLPAGIAPARFEPCQTIRETLKLRLQQQKEAAKKAEKEARTAERKQYRDAVLAAEKPVQS